MARMRFNEMLAERRRELGISLAQVSSILKLKEQVLIAFENADFEHIPQSGYAQGMLSSYARYLGLPAREIVDLFQEDMFEWQHGSLSHELRQRTRDNAAGRGIAGYNVLNESGSRPKAYVEYRGLLPTAGGPAGDMGDFSTVSPARSRQGDSYGENSYTSRDYAPNSLGSSMGARARSRYSSRSAQEPADRLLRQNLHQPDAPSNHRTQIGASSRMRMRSRDAVTSRGVPAEYRDDMRFDDRARSYESASTQQGRLNSRNISQVQRPNITRQPRNTNARRYQNSRAPQNQGLLGLINQFLSDPRNRMFLIGLVLVGSLVAITIFGVSSCISAKAGSAPSKTVAVNSAESTDTTDDSAEEEKQETATTKTNTDGSQTSSKSSDDKDATVTEETAKKPTQVSVSVASGQVSWVEITLDGKSVVADTITGSWSQTYSVTDSITISVGNPTVVTVTKDGESQSFTSKTTGVGSITIKGNGVKEDGTTTTDDKNTSGSTGQNASGTSSTKATGTSTNTNSTTKATSTKQNTNA